MSVQPSDIFRLLSLRGPQRLGGTPVAWEDRAIARRSVLEEHPPAPAEDEAPTKLQAARKRRGDLLLRLHDLKALQRTAADLYTERLQVAYTPPTPKAIQVGAPQKGLLRKAVDFVFGQRPSTVPFTRPDPVALPRIDVGFRDDLKARVNERQRMLFLAVESTFPGGDATVTREVFDAGIARVAQQASDEANDACRDIHLWEDETEKPDTQMTPVVLTDANRPAVRAIGFGDLIVARERLIGYDANEIAHIENVLPGENRLREHERTTRREVVTETEMEEETTSENDLETTDRFELQVQSQETINTQMKLDAGMNTSGKYGLTTVETSLEGGLSRSVEESRNTTSNLAREVVSRAVEEVRKFTREMRRVTTVEQITEKNSHGINREGDKTNPFSGVYYWVEKIQEVELRHYGTRLMIEFFIPEPGLALLPANNQNTQPFRKPAPLAFGPEAIDENNFRCLTAHYGAVDVEPPPPELIQVGFRWASTPRTGPPLEFQSVKEAGLNIPEGYLPDTVHGAAASLDMHNWFELFLAIGGQEILHGQWLGHVVFFRELESKAPAPDGLPMVLRGRNFWNETGVLSLIVVCQRSQAHFHLWQLRTYERIREAHALLVSDYERRVAQAAIQGGVQIAGRPAAENRAREVEELTKWAIKTMRLVPFDFNAIVRQLQQEEIDPIVSDAYAPIMRFFQDSFEWREMSYILFPYYWARRDTYGYRRNLVDTDPLHQAFLRAGAARVIVPVTPGFEERLLQYLDTQGNANLTELERVSDPNPTPGADDVWLEVLLNRRTEVARGSGTLNVTQGSNSLTINGDSNWTPDNRDIGRELIVRGEVFTITAFQNQNLTIDRPYDLPSDQAATYATGSVRVGQPWSVRVPTSLVILAEEREKLLSNINQQVHVQPNP